MNARISIKAVEFDVEYDYQPEEKETRDDPGCYEEIEAITAITHKGTDFYEFFEDELEMIE